MGWGYYVIDGRPCGYGVAALCDSEYCFERIDRGMGWLCGQMPGGDEHGCGGYFCGGHEADHGCPVDPIVDIVDIDVHTHGMTQNEMPNVPAAEVTAAMLATDCDFVVVTPSGARIGEMPSLAFGLGAWDGDTEGFAAWLREQA